MNLEIETVTYSDHTLLRLTGELDAYTAPKLKDQLLAFLRQENQQVKVDLSPLEYMDSTGLGVFIGALKASKQHNSHMTLLNPQQRIERLFDITGLAEVMEIRQEEEGQ